MSDAKKVSEIEIELEAPPMQDFGAEQLTGLNGQDGSREDRMRAEVAARSLELLGKNLTFAEFTRELLLLMMKCFQCEAGSILELDQKENVFFFRASVGTVSDRLPDFTIPLHKGIVGECFDKKEPLLVTDAGGHEGHLRSVTAALGFEITNLVAIPLLIRGRGFGVLELINFPAEHAGAESLATLRVLSTLISKALEIRLTMSWALRKAA